MEKQEIRKEIKSLCKENADRLAGESERICKRIIESEQYEKAEVILAYMALADEVHLSAVISDALKKNKKVAVPKITDFENGVMHFFYLDAVQALSSQTQSGTLGINEPDEQKASPLNINEIKNKNILILVPGRAFTKKGDRLGRGKGFYDRFLGNGLRSNNVVLAGVCFDFQIKKSLPVDDRDIKMDIVFL